MNKFIRRLYALIVSSLFTSVAVAQNYSFAESPKSTNFQRLDLLLPPNLISLTAMLFYTITEYVEGNALFLDVACAFANVDADLRGFLLNIVSDTLDSAFESLSAYKSNLSTDVTLSSTTIKCEIFSSLQNSLLKLHYGGLEEEYYLDSLESILKRAILSCNNSNININEILRPTYEYIFNR